MEEGHRPGEQYDNYLLSHHKTVTVLFASCLLFNPHNIPEICIKRKRTLHFRWEYEKKNDCYKEEQS